MAGGNFTSPSQPQNSIKLSGGVNSTAGPFGVDDSESTDLQNIDFNKFGSIIKRNGYAALNTVALQGSPAIDSLHWYEAVISGSQVRYAMVTAGTNLYKMDSLSGTWDNITGNCTLTAGNHADSENWLNEAYFTNGLNVPVKWSGTGNGTTVPQPTSVTKPKYIKQFNNYMFIGNVVVSGTAQTSRIYWSDLKSTTTWTSTNFIDISKDDGQQITGLRVLSDKLVVFKERSIYNVTFTGDVDLPFILPGGGKSNSNVGCVAPFSIQEVENGLVFLSLDGFYFYDGNNSYKISDRINTTLLGYNITRFNQAVSCKQLSKSRYFCALTGPSATTNNKVIVWDWFNNAFSIYSGMAPSSMATFYVSGLDERPHFGDYSGFAYRMDSGSNDNPLNVATAINAYYYTNWKTFGDIVDQKGIPNVVIYYQNSNSVLTFSYSYDFETTDHYAQTLSLATSTAVYGTAVYGTDTYANAGGAGIRQDLDGRGRVVRYKFSNSTLSETFQIDGIGSFPHLETNSG